MQSLRSALFDDTTQAAQSYIILCCTGVASYGALWHVPPWL